MSQADEKIAMAAGAHPDDIEFMMAGTLGLLGKAGYRLHYLNIATGSCGTVSLDRHAIVATRTAEARESAAVLGAAFHEPLVDDIEIYYERPILARLGAIVRQVQPRILLIQSPWDYMEDHVNSCRLMVTAAFCRGMRNFRTDPPMPPTSQPLAVYHALPYGLRDPLRQPIRPHLYVDVSTMIDLKRRALACHRSQKEWLDKSQGLDSYLTTMTDMCAQMGRASGRFAMAEGWLRHLHLGFGSEEFDPLTEALGKLVLPAAGGDGHD